MPAFSTIALIGSLAYGAYSSSRAQKKAAKDAPPLPVPEAPIGVPEVGEAAATKRNKAIKAGRQGDILTGSLAPTNVGKKRLLGGT